MRSFTVRCAGETVATLRAIAKLWPNMTAAHQSNLMWKALDVSAEMDPEVFKTLPRHQISFDGELMSETDIARLKQLGGLWCEITPSAQLELLDQVQDSTRIDLSSTSTQGDAATVKLQWPAAYKADIAAQLAAAR